MYLHPQKCGPSTCKSADADMDADADTDYCSYVLYNPSFCNLRMRIWMRTGLFRPLQLPFLCINNTTSIIELPINQLSALSKLVPRPSLFKKTMQVNSKHYSFIQTPGLFQLLTTSIFGYGWYTVIAIICAFCFMFLFLTPQSLLCSQRLNAMKL